MRMLVYVLALLVPMMGQAAERVALVIGNADYPAVGTLKNTINDANMISDTLDGIGFEVTKLTNATLRDMRQALEDFSFRAETADLALVYFAGHGVEVQGENFLIATDAKVSSNLDIQRQSVSLKEVLNAVESARKMRIVILDSCRNNPFGDAIDQSQVAEVSASTDQTTRGSGGGLAVPNPDRGTLVSFAAKDGSVALDGSGNNSPFAISLAEKLARPGLEISLMFRQVRDQVLKITFNQQEPHTYGSLSGIPFYLAGPTDGQDVSAELDRRVAWSNIRPEQELQLAKLAEGGDTRSMLGLAYMRLNPKEERFDPSQAVGLLTRAADAGSPEAQFELAKLYEKGLGVAQNEARALELYRASADQNFADALNDLGFMYYQGGLGLGRDSDQALRYFERAADQKHPQAMFNFAALIDDGLIKGKGPEEAAAYLYQALRSGSQDVYKILSDRPNMFKLETRKALQQRLRQYDFYTGTIDGDFGPGTQRGIRKAYGLKS